MRLTGQGRQHGATGDVNADANLSRRARVAGRNAGLVLVAAAALALGACSPNVIKHGHQFRDTDIQQIQPGMSQEQVKLTLGSPATTATVNNGAAFYYISSTANQVAFLLPKEVDRQVLAVYFNQVGTVDHVAHYGMKDGKVFDFVSQKTPAPGVGDDGLLKQLFRNLGKKQIFGGE